jgi:hypothetical protein
MIAFCPIVGTRPLTQDAGSLQKDFVNIGDIFGVKHPVKGHNAVDTFTVNGCGVVKFTPIVEKTNFRVRL